MIMNREFIEHNRRVDELRNKEYQEYMNKSFDRYLNRTERYEEEDYATPRW